jgi:ABC-type transport system involved in multi-copper enzyme maturation permease subunit
MNLFRELVTDNPMMAEVFRRMRRFTLSKDHRQSLLTALALGVAVFLLTALTFAQSGAFTPWAIALIKLPLLCAALPLAMHGSIAGERDRRSWDALCAAPVTDAQIVAGKFAVGLTVLAAVWLAFLPMELSALVTEVNRDRLADALVTLRLDFYTLLVGMFVASLSFLASARSRRPFAALGATGGALGALLIVSNVLLFSASATDAKNRFYQPVVALLNPVLHLVQITDGSQNTWSRDMSLGWKLAPEFGALIYLALGIAMLVVATRTLHAADQEVVASSPKSTTHA